MSLVNLSQLVNLCDGSDCNQMFLLNLAEISGAVQPSAANMGIPLVHHAEPVAHHVAASVPIGVPRANHMGIPAKLSATMPIGVPRANHMGVPAKLSAKIPIGVPRANHMGVPAKLTATMPSAAHMGIPVAHHAKPVVHHVAAPVAHHAMPVVHHVAPVVHHPVVHHPVVHPVVHKAMHHAAPWDNTFDTQNIDVNQIDSTGNVDIGLMNLLAEMAMPAMDLTHDDFHTQDIVVNQIDSAGNVDVGLMNLCSFNCPTPGGFTLI